MDAVRAMVSADLQLRWHLVGHLQTNKARKAGARFDVVHSIDTPDLLRKLDRPRPRPDIISTRSCRWISLARRRSTAREERELSAIFEAGRSASHVKLVGLMLLPPAVDNPDDARPYFRELRGRQEPADGAGVDPAMLAELSMGMSHDFEVAVEEGATIVRVGTAIFGSRPLTIAESETGTTPIS